MFQFVLKNYEMLEGPIILHENAFTFSRFIFFFYQFLNKIVQVRF